MTFKPKTCLLPTAVLFALLMLVGCARPLHPMLPAQQLAYPEDRITDNVIHHDYNVYRDTQTRIRTLNDHGIPIKDYQLSKAQCWLDVSFHEYSRNDRGHFPHEALNESQRILTALENRQDPGMETPLVNHAEKLRPDLWARFDALKHSAGFACAAQQTACGEVELVHAGNEVREAGWRHARPYIQIAEDFERRATVAADACPRAAPTPVAVPAPVIPSAPITLSADTLFHFDRSSRADLLPQGRAELDALADNIIHGSAHIAGLTIIGYTDRLGSAAYNLKLSVARAHTVKTYLQERGVTVPMAIEGRGKANQVVACAGVAPRKKLIVCLQPNRRVEVHVQGK